MITEIDGEQERLLNELFKNFQSFDLNQSAGYLPLTRSNWKTLSSIPFPIDDEKASLGEQKLVRTFSPKADNDSPQVEVLRIDSSTGRPKQTLIYDLFESPDTGDGKGPTKTSRVVSKVNHEIELERNFHYPHPDHKELSFSVAKWRIIDLDGVKDSPEGSYGRVIVNRVIFKPRTEGKTLPTFLLVNSSRYELASPEVLAKMGKPKGGRKLWMEAERTFNYHKTSIVYVRSETGIMTRVTVGDNNALFPFEEQLDKELGYADLLITQPNR